MAPYIKIRQEAPKGVSGKVIVQVITKQKPFEVCKKVGQWQLPAKLATCFYFYAVFRIAE